MPTLETYPSQSKKNSTKQEDVDFANLRKFLCELQAADGSKFEFNHFHDTDHKITLIDVLSSSFGRKEKERYTDFCERVFKIKKGTIEFEWLFSGLWKYTDNSLGGAIFRLENYMEHLYDHNKKPVPEYFTGFDKSPFRPGWSDKFEY